MVGMATLVYLVSPIDLIPEMIFGILGYLDDLIAVIFMAVYVSAVYRAYVIGTREQQQTQELELQN
jgi:RING finger protein 170